MRKTEIALFVAIVMCMTAAIANAQVASDGRAGIIINPTRVVMEGRDRSASVTIVNNGSAAGNYRVELVNKYMDEDGKFQEVAAPKEGDMFADKILRISPRRFSIEAGEEQSIRILVRKPKGLKDGEYRSHLSVYTVPDNAPSSNSTDDDKVVISVRANYGVTIPVIVRSGHLSAAAEIENIKYVPKSGTEKEDKIKFNIKRTGEESLYGDIKITYVNKLGIESVVKFLGGIAIYTPNNIRKFEIPLDVDGKVKIAQGGVFKVLYQEKESSGGTVIAQRDFNM